MSFTGYQEYKHTSAEWLGDIPSHWGVKRLKYCVKHVDEKISGDDSTAPFVGLEHIESWTGRLITDDESTSTGVVNAFKKGDVLFGKLRPYLAKVYETKTDGICTGEVLILRSYKEVVPRFLLYFLLNPLVIENINGSTYGAKMPRANWEFIGNQLQVLPRIDEQHAITTFLDNETARIDTLIEKKRRLLALLEEKRLAVIIQAVTKGLDPTVSMKDSGIDWLGKVPAHWETYKVTHGFDRVGSGTTPKSGAPEYYEEGTVNWLTTSELRENEIFETSVKVTKRAVFDHSALRIYPPGAIVIAMYGATIGRLGILRSETTVNQACCVFDQPIHFMPKFFYYWLMGQRNILVSLSYGGGQPNLSQDILRSLRVPAPPLEEQKQIVEYLDQKTTQQSVIDNQVQAAIDLLSEYRSALITNAVTGKIDVRDLTGKVKAA